eukprot:2187218-Ditylum_brightwellii.AAC.1
MNATDKDIWDQSYAEEYSGLHHDTHTWEYIMEEECSNLWPQFGHALPTIDLATIKPDEFECPQCAKYCICVLGNMDPNDWSKTECFAPVMTQIELRLLVAAAVQMGRSVKGGDFKQAFCQSYLPPLKATY